MYPFSHSVTPAIRSHLDAQVSFFNDMSKSLSRSFQRLCELNIQLGQTMLEEGNIARNQMLTTDNPTDAIAIVASRAQPTAEKLRAYQQHISRVVADAQIGLARVNEEHAPVTSRTARDLADRVAQAASEETEHNSTKQQEMMNTFRDPFQHAGTHGSMQSANGIGDVDGKRNAAGFQGGEQGSQSGQTTASKGGAKQN